MKSSYYMMNCHHVYIFYHNYSIIIKPFVFISNNNKQFISNICTKSTDALYNFEKCCNLTV